MVHKPDVHRVLDSNVLAAVYGIAIWRDNTTDPAATLVATNGLAVCSQTAQHNSNNSRERHPYTMIYARLFTAYGILLCISLFMVANIRVLGGTEGYFFLGLAGLLVVFLIVASNDFDLPLRLRPSFLLVLFFLGLYITKYYFESGSYPATREIAIGTTGGVLFSFGMGLSCAYALSIIYQLRMRETSAKLAWSLALVFVGITLILSLDALRIHLGGVRADVFLIEEQEGNYQRAGNLATAQVILVCALAVVMRVTMLPGQRKAKAYSLHFLITGLTMAYAFMAQLIGSNSGMVATIAITFGYLLYMLLFSGRRGVEDLSSQFQRSGIRLMAMFKKLGPKVIVSAMFALLILGTAGVTVMNHLNVSAGELRITGYGDGESESAKSRARVFQNNFLRHFTYAPVFGNTQVDVLTSGAGTYIHSLFAILTHMGMFGFVVFSGLVANIYRELFRPMRHGKSNLHADQRFDLYKLLCITILFVLCSVSAFFTWLPLWFGIGLLAVKWRI